MAADGEFRSRFNRDGDAAGEAHAAKLELGDHQRGGEGWG